MEKREILVQNLNGNVIVGSTIQVMVAGTNTPATIFADRAGATVLLDLKTDGLGQAEFYAPNGRYDVFTIINGQRVAHETDALMYDPEDDTRVTEGGSGSGGGDGSGGGTGAGNRDEVLLVADVNGVITPDGALSNRFRIKLTADVKLANPVNFANNEHIYLAGFQDSTGGHKLTYGLDYLLPAGLPFAPPTAGGAAFTAELRPTLHPDTDTLVWFLLGEPDNSKNPSGYGLATATMRIKETGAIYYANRLGLAEITTTQTAIILRNCTSYEATGTITGTSLSDVFHIVGAPVINNGADQRPMVKLLTTDFGEGPPRGLNRPSFGKALINLEGKGTTYVRDLRISGARNDDGDARGICNNSDGMTLYVQNVEITDCNNGIENGNTTMVGDTFITDVLIDKCGVGSPDVHNSHGTGSSSGFTHSIYMGHNNRTVTIARTTMSNSVNGNNVKCRTGHLIATQLLCTSAAEGRELEVPNGGVVEIDNSSFIKPASSNNGSLVIVGGNGGGPNSTEGLDTTRPRKYKFTNCLFRSDYSVSGAYSGRDGYLVCNLDPDVPLEFVDCKFEGELASSNLNDPNNKPLYAGTVTVNGIRYMSSAPPIFTYTGGPVGPILPVGYQPIAMTPIA